MPRLRALLVGVEGLALLRRLYDDDPEQADERLAEGRRVVEDESFAVEEVTTETDPRTGYGLWAERYDQRGNSIVALAQVVRLGGRLVIWVLHPFRALLGWQAPFEDAGGRRSFVREYPHTHGEYFDAFAACGLSVRGCHEPRLDDELIQSKRRAFTHIPEATLTAYAGLPAVLVWGLQKGATPSPPPG